MRRATLPLVFIAGILVTARAFSATWQIQEAGETLNTANACHLDLDLTVDSQDDVNNLTVTGTNQSDQTLFIDPEKIHVDFSGNVFRARVEGLSAKTIVLPPAEKVQKTLILESDTDFYEHKVLHFRVPVRDGTPREVCVIEGNLVKWEEPVTSYQVESSKPSRFELSLGLGAPMASAAGLDSLGTAVSPLMQLMGTYFFSDHNGASLLLGAQSRDANGGAADAISGGIPSGFNTEVMESYFALDFTHRERLNHHWNVAYSAGPGYYYFDLTGYNLNFNQDSWYDYAFYGDLPTQDFGNALRFFVSQQLGVEWHNGNTGIGLNFYDMWIPSGSWGPISVTGSRFGALITFNMYL